MKYLCILALFLAVSRALPTVNIKVSNVNISRSLNYTPTFFLEDNSLVVSTTYFLSITLLNQDGSDHDANSISTTINLLDESSFAVSTFSVDNSTLLKLPSNSNITISSVVPIKFKLGLTMLQEYHPSLSNLITTVKNYPSLQNVLTLASTVSTTFPQYPLWRLLIHSTRKNCSFLAADNSPVIDGVRRNSPWTLFQYVSIVDVNSLLDFFGYRPQISGKFLMFCPDELN